MMDTNVLWNDFISSKYELFISPVVMDEIDKCSEPRRSQMIQKLSELQIQILAKMDHVENLAREYIKGNVLKEKNFDDCLHIAFAVVYNCDIIVSWNFKHLVNYKTINKTKIVNAVNHYREISIVSPTMLIEEEDET